MKEMRRDQITGDLIIYSSYRNKRPHDTIKSNKNKPSEGPQYSDTCPFCRGNEHLNDMPTYLIEKEGQWLAKSVKNKFPIVDTVNTRLLWRLIDMRGPIITCP